MPKRDGSILFKKMRLISAKRKTQIFIKPRLVLSRFWICAKIPGILKKNQLEEFVSPVKKSALLHASNMQNFVRQHFFDVNEVCIVFS